MISPLFTEIKEFIEHLDHNAISAERKKLLQPLLDYIQNKVKNEEEIRLNFICTHNSRRSHFSQIWAQTMAASFNIKNVVCYSAGTEETALFPMVIETLKNTGFQIETISKDENPIYSIKYAQNEHPIIGFSKRIEDHFNPKSDFAAVMTCDSADVGCPFVPGAEFRTPLLYEDPKTFDNTPEQVEKYRERNLQIATEMHYLFSNIKS